MMKILLLNLLQMVNVVRDSGPPPELLHGDPSKFLRKVQSSIAECSHSLKQSTYEHCSHKGYI